MISSFNDALNFEEKSNIFSIHNNDEIYLWDIFRYFVWEKLRFERQTPTNFTKKQNLRKLISQRIKAAGRLYNSLCLLSIDTKRYDNLFFLASRNQFENSFIDQNQYDTYKLLSAQKNLLIETFGIQKLDFYENKLYYYGCLRHLAKFYYHIKLSENDYICINKIIELLKNNFGELNFTEYNLISLLKDFYLDAKLWNKLLKRHKIKKVFLTQNGIQKGIFYAAKKLSIPVYEFQHGIISKGHPAYSYPKINGIEKSIYIPYKFLTLSDYWCKTFYCPIINQSIGNNYFSKPVEKINNPSRILVISANIFGKELAKILKDGIYAGIIKPSDLIFKLHPNQYFEKEYYNDFFDGKVTVITNEKSVNELLSEAKFMITVCSTAAYEALQANTRVLVYKISMYREMELLFNDENLFLFSNTEELKQGLQSALPEEYEAPVFFEECIPQKIQKAIEI